MLEGHHFSDWIQYEESELSVAEVHFLICVQYYITLIKKYAMMFDRQDSKSMDNQKNPPFRYTRVTVAHPEGTNFVHLWGGATLHEVIHHSNIEILLWV